MDAFTSFLKRLSLAGIDRARSVGCFFGRPHILFFTLPWLMVLIVLGTLAQKNMGIYEATEKYFNSMILWLGPIPTPGGLLTIGTIFIALSIKFIFFSTWNRKKAGTILTHLGVLLLLLGGIVTSVTAREGFMIIPEGDSNNAISSYRERILSFSNDDGIIKSVNFKNLNHNQIINILDLEIKILDLCQNCSAQAPSGKYEDLQGLAQNMELVGIPHENDSERDFSGITLQVIQAKNSDAHGTYILMEDVPRTPTLETNQGSVDIKLEREKEPLPFSITLNDFRKIDYPGTIKAREFESDLIIEDNDLSWPVTIRMNEPLRYKGYTFYQSSFDQIEGNEITVLSVVQNSGRAFPYISSLIIFLGLLIHLMIRLQTKERRA